MVLPKYLLAVLSGIHSIFGLCPKYLLAVLSGIRSIIGMPKRGNFEVSISGAFEYPLARYPLYRNVSVTDTGELMIHA